MNVLRGRSYRPWARPDDVICQLGRWPPQECPLPQVRYLPPRDCLLARRPRNRLSGILCRHAAGVNRRAGQSGQRGALPGALTADVPAYPREPSAGWPARDGGRGHVRCAYGSSGNSACGAWGDAEPRVLHPSSATARLRDVVQSRAIEPGSA